MGIDQLSREQLLQRPIQPAPELPFPATSLTMARHDDDPFATFTRPPPNETAQERAVRETREAAAKKRSDAIDEDLRKEKLRLKKEEKNLVRVLLLGQSESGESAHIGVPSVLTFRCREIDNTQKCVTFPAISSVNL